jgi:hypothetical protein
MIPIFGVVVVMFGDVLYFVILGWDINLALLDQTHD